MKRKKTFSKTIAKRLAGKCLFCGEDDINLLDAHRIIPGSENGQYCHRNTIINCSNCHRKIHSNRIVVEGKFFSSGGRWVVSYTEDGVERIAYLPY